MLSLECVPVEEIVLGSLLLPSFGGESGRPTLDPANVFEVKGGGKAKCGGSLATVVGPVPFRGCLPSFDIVIVSDVITNECDC